MAMGSGDYSLDDAEVVNARRFMGAGNWKANGTTESVKSLMQDLNEGKLEIGASTNQQPLPSNAVVTGDSIRAYGEGMDQDEMMESDFVIPVDKYDNPLGGELVSKRRAHEFSPSRPRGILHRAFSVFLFNGRNELLLTQRASPKITFPNVWTNTCCSHPLEGMVPNEVDTNEEYPRFSGTKRAAIRKLRHELGIDPRDVPFDGFHFLTRFHYWAADTITYGKDAPWGEHEVDYIFFIRCDQEPALNVNAEEISDREYVSLSKLKEIMYDQDKPLREGKMLFSPWFRRIMENGGFDWMEDLDGAFGGKYTNRDITYFDPPKEHYASYNLDSHDRDTGVMNSEDLDY